MEFKKHLPFFILFTALWIAFMGTTVVMKAISGYVAVYASIAMNMSHGVGSPAYAQTVLPQFYGHPPFMMYFESFFLHLFGNGYSVEKLYGLFMAVLNMSVTYSLFYAIHKRFHFYWIWLVIFGGMLTILNSYVYQGNMLEGALVIFTTLLVYFIWKNVERFLFVFLTCSGLCIVLVGFKTPLRYEKINMKLNNFILSKREN